MFTWLTNNSDSVRNETTTLPSTNNTKSLGDSKSTCWLVSYLLSHTYLINLYVNKHLLKFSSGSRFMVCMLILICVR